MDTSVWSEALRRRSGRLTQITAELNTLIEDHRVVMLGPIRQELLSGVKTPEVFEDLRSSLRAFPDEPITTDHYEAAAQFYNMCKARGVTGTFIDLLICAVAVAEDFGVFTSDKDFEHFRRVIPLRLHRPSVP